MSTTDTTTATTATTAVTALPLAPGAWALDPFHSQVTFAIRHLGLAKVRGRFARFDATLEVGERAEDVRVTATIDLDSIDTGNADRDAHVRQPELLDTAAHPTLEFRSTRVTGGGDAWTMDGELTTHGVTRPVTLDVEFNGTDDGMGVLHAGFSTSGSLSRKDFGIGFGPVADAGLGDKVTFDIDLEFVTPDATPAAG